MLIGSGLIANAFSSYLSDESVCIYAAGVSNSGCKDISEYNRERIRLLNALNESECRLFVYFGTCSVYDPSQLNSAYVNHKLLMEELVRSHSQKYLIIRLPQVAGISPNPHTLLNFLHARIYRSESFDLWINTKRNIIDVDDVKKITDALISNNQIIKSTVNIANEHNYFVVEIVKAFEMVLGKMAVYKTIQSGTDFFIDTSHIKNIIANAKVRFNDEYLINTISKYYSSECVIPPNNKYTQK